MAEEMENDLNSMQQESLLFIFNQTVLSEDDGESSLLPMNNIILEQNALDEQTEPFPSLENTGTVRQQTQQFFNFQIRQNSLQDEGSLVLLFSVDPANEFLMFYYNCGDEMREEIIENSLVMVVIVTEGYELSDEGPSEIHSQGQSHLNNLVTQTQLQNTLDFEAESAFSEEYTGARSHGAQVQQYNFIQQNSLADEPCELVFSVDPVNEFMMFRYNLSEEIWEEP